jgi:spore germination protein
MIIHTVKKGDTLYSIAKEYSVPYEIINELNMLPDPSKLSIGQAIIVRIPSELYKVRRGDTLFSVSRKFAIPEKTLLRNNPKLMGLDDLTEGEELVIRYEDPDPIKSFAVSGYVYPEVQTETLQKSLPYLSYITPFSYGLTSEGNLVSLSDEKIIEKALSYSVKPVMLLTTLNDSGVFDNTLSNILLEDEELQSRLISQILAVMQIKEYSALDVDFEFIYPEDKDAYVSFIKRLKDTLSPYGYEVWVALAPKTSDDQKGLLYEAHDYRELGEAADKVLLMTYEWGYTYGPSMAVAPLDKVREVVKYAVSRIPRNKIFMGIPNYGYDFTLPFVEGESRATTITNASAPLLAYEKGSQILFDEKSASPFFRYNEGNSLHEVWFEDARSINDKLLLASEFELYGIGFWNLMNYFQPAFSTLSALYNIK